MIQRCYNTNNQDYKYYGAKGVAISQKWIDDPNTFLSYVEQLPHYQEEGYTLDRLDGNGNYEEGNVRWATAGEQAINQGIYANNTSGYKGVHLNKISARLDRPRVWMSRISIDGKRKELGLHLTKEDAVFARNRYIVENRLPHKIQQIV